MLFTMTCYGISCYRKQRVKINGCYSEWGWADVISDIPRGTILGPVLFIIYINDLPEICKRLNFSGVPAARSKISGHFLVTRSQTHSKHILFLEHKSFMKINNAVITLLESSAVSMWYSYISIDIDQYFTKYLDIDTPAIVAGQSGAKTQCSVYQYRYLQ